MDKYTELREALDAKPTPGPWERHQTGGYTKCVRQASPTGAGRGICSTFVQNTPKTAGQHERQRAQNNVNSDYIAACHPEAIRALLAERDALRGRLEAAVNYIDTLGGDSKGLRSALAQEEA